MFRTLIATLLLFCLPGYASAAKLNVVVSFSILGDMTQKIAGDQVTLTTLVAPGGDAHVYEPSPDDARKLAAADLVIVNGLGFEGWIDRLIASSGFKGTAVVASSGVAPIATQANTYDPHAWQSLVNGQIYAANIRDALMKADPANAKYYADNAKLYIGQLAVMDKWVRSEIAKVPADKRKAVIPHNSMRYFTQAYDVEFITPLGISTAGDPSARDIARLIDVIRSSNLQAVFLENMANPRLMQQIETDSGVKISGTLYTDALSDAKGDAPTYTGMFKYNVTLMTLAMQGKPTFIKS